MPRPFQYIRQLSGSAQPYRGPDLEAQNEAPNVAVNNETINGPDTVLDKLRLEARKYGCPSHWASDTLSSRSIAIKASRNHNSGLLQNNGNIVFNIQVMCGWLFERKPRIREGVSQGLGLRNVAEPALECGRINLSGQELAVTLDPNDILRRQRAIIIILLCLLYEFMRNLGVLSIHLLPSRRTIPPMMSFLLPENLTFIDGMGDRFSLPLWLCCGRPVLEGFIKSRWSKDRKGYQKIQSGQYKIFNVKNPAIDITEQNWNDLVQARTTIRMAIIISSLRISNRCMSCGTRLRLFNDKSQICPKSSCGKFFRTSDPEVTTCAWMKRMPPSSEFLDVPDLLNLRAHTYFEQLVMAFEDICDRQLNNLVFNHLNKISKSPDNSDEYHSFRSSAREREWPRKPSGIGVRITRENGTGYIGPVGDGDYLTSVRNQADTSNLKTVEESEVRSFTSICIEQDASLYEAAMEGNVELVSQLTRQRSFDIINSKGSAGKSLIAAILKSSVEIVEILLKAGTDPLIPCIGDDAPIPAAACYGSTRVLGLLLRFAMRQSSTRPKLFQDAVDNALLQAASMHRFRMLPMLLYAGANPIALIVVGMALSVADKLDQLNPGKIFLAEVWNRGLITDLEAKILSSGLNGGMPVADIADVWLSACGRGLQDRINAILHDNRFFELRRRSTPSTFPHGRGQRYETHDDDGPSGVVV